MEQKSILTVLMAVVAATMGISLIIDAGIINAEHQPRPDHTDERIDDKLDDRCPDEIPGNEPSEGRACHGLETANNHATR